MAPAKKKPVDLVEVKEPTVVQDREARKIYITEFNKLRLTPNTGFVPRGKLKELMKELGAWSDELENEYDKLRKEIDELLEPLKSGNIPLAEMKERAQQAQIRRIQLSVLNTTIAEYDQQFTYEAQAEEARQQYLRYACSYKKGTNEPFFGSFEEFVGCDDAELIVKIVSELNLILYGSIKEMYREMPENKFLYNYNFIDEDLNPTEKVEVSEVVFTDEKGQPVKPTHA